MLTVDEVLQLIREKVSPLLPVKLPLNEAVGRVLAESIIMAEDSPPFDRAVLDGYAVRGGEVVAGTILEVVGQTHAGNSRFGRGLESGECIQINTGAPMPLGGDAVLMVEHTEAPIEEGGRTYVRASRAVATGYAVQRRGADAAAGAVVLAVGSRLSPAGLGICAAAGFGEVAVRRMRAAVLTTGDELVEPSEIPGEGKIRNSNRPMLLGLLREAMGGGVVVGEELMDLGSCGDEAGRMRELLRKGLEEADLLVVSGGMSMGTKDLVPPLLTELGVAFFVEKVRIKPGKPFVFGVFERKNGGEMGFGGDKSRNIGGKFGFFGGKYGFVAGLPGNPVSAFVTFQRFVREIVARLLAEDTGSRMIEAEMNEGLEANAEREFYLPCRLTRRGATVVAEAVKWKGSADLFSLAAADGVIVRAAGAGGVEKGAVVRVLRW